MIITMTKITEMSIAKTMGLKDIESKDKTEC